MKSIKIMFCLLLLLPSFSFAEEPTGRITVTGTSELTIAPQYSIIFAELKTVHTEIDASYQDLHTTLTDIISNLKKLGLTDKDITKSTIRQGSEFTWRNNSRVQTGFYSSSSLQIRINDISTIHLIYRHLSKYKSLKINGTKYGRHDTETLRNKELQKALLQAHSKAQLMAATLGLNVDRVINIIESGAQPGVPRPMLRSNSAPENSGGTFGSVTITAQVVVEFAIVKAANPDK